MQPMSRSERTALCNTALELGPEAGTLCTGWSVYDLVVHLLVRERDVRGAGIVIRPLAGLTEGATRRVHGQDFTTLVERLRGGPPLWSPLRIRPVDQVANGLEFFVHHEDILRAQPGWRPRELTPRQQDKVFRAFALASKALLRPVEVPLVLVTPDGRTITARTGAAAETVTVIGEPAELVLFGYGRGDVARVTVDGPQGQVARLQTTDLGL